MAEYGGVNPMGKRPSTVRSNGGLQPEQPLTLNLSESTTRNSTKTEVQSPAGHVTPNPWGTRPGSLDIDDYFVSVTMEL